MCEHSTSGHSVELLVIHVLTFACLLKTMDAPTLQNLSFSVKSEQLLAVIGPVGAGKVRFHLHFPWLESMKCKHFSGLTFQFHSFIVVA